MWTIRKASIRIKSQPFSSVSFRACYAKFETTCSSYTNNIVLGIPSHITDRSTLLKRFSSQAHDSQISFIGKHHFSSQAGTKNNEEESDGVKDDFSGLDTSSDVAQEKDVEHESNNALISEADMLESENEDDDLVVEEVTENNCEGRRGFSGLFKAIVDSPPLSTLNALDKWLEEGNVLSRSEISHATFELRRRRMYGKALELSQWLEAQKNVEFVERDYASRVDLIAKTRGLQKAEVYIEKIPELLRGEIVYRTLLANCVLYGQTKKAENVFNKMKDLKFPISAFACNQLLLLFKRTDKKKIADMLLLMEKENVKPSLFTYRLLIDIKGQSNDLVAMEKVLETMRAEGLEPDLRLKAALARHYVYGGMKEKAKEVLKEMEGSNLIENRRAFTFLLPIYALLGNIEDVERVWEICRSDPQLFECISAIDAFGKLQKVEEAEAVFDQMSKKWKQLSSKHYTAMLKVYANNKMLLKGKNLVKQMGESGCRIGPLTWDALIKLYVESGELEKADSFLIKASQQIATKPLFATYMMVLGQYAKRGDVHNAEKIFHRMRQDGYVSRFKQHTTLLQAYINANTPAYGFRERLKADNIFPTKVLAAQLAQVDAFKKTAVSDLLD